MIWRLLFLLFLSSPLQCQEYKRVDVVFHTIPTGARLYRLNATPTGDFLGTSGQPLPLERRSTAPFYLRIEADGYQTVEALVGSEIWREGRWPQHGSFTLESRGLRARLSTVGRQYWPLLVFGVASLLVGARLMRRRRRQLMMLETYLPRQILETLLRDGGQARPMTMLVSDIADFSTVCERESAQSVATRLDSHYRDMTEVITTGGGCIVHFVGDQFVVLFEGPDHVPRGLRTARAMLARLAELSRLDAYNQQGFYRVRIGLHSGQMALEKRQSSTKLDYVIVGTDSRKAYEVQEETKAYSVNLLVSAETAALLEGQAQFVAHGAYFEPT